MASQLKNALVILRRETVETRTGHCRSSIYEMMKDPLSKFPQSIKISARAVGWLESEINDYIQARIDSSRKPEKEGA